MTDTLKSKTDKKADNQAEKPPEKFPDAYASFLPVLDRLSDSLKAVLRGHLLSLEDLFRTVQSRNTQIIGDFEGIGGLTQRGDISRILQSELLLRTEAPLEFLRRIVESETLYMETEHSDPGENTVYRLMISVGPELLGHGRMIALAGLLFLARIAQVKNTELHWCYLPNANGVHWFTGISVNGIKRFLKFASYTDATEEQIEEAHKLWADVFAANCAHDTQYHDWILGGQNPHINSDNKAIATTPNTLMISLQPPVENTPRRGEISLKQNGSIPRTLLLDFPPDRICVSALNNPFRPLKPTVKQIDNNNDTALPKIGGWEPRYLCSYGPNNHIIRFSNVRAGLLFIPTTHDTKITEAAFLPLPDNIQLAGVNYKGFRAQLLTQYTKDGTEIMAFNSFYPASPNPHHDRFSKKTVTSAHLFKKQRSHVLPILHNHQHDSAKCYTTMGQAIHFDASNGNNNSPKFNILYKEKKIIAASGIRKIVFHDPKNQTYAQRTSQDKYEDFTQPSLQAIKGRGKYMFTYPIPKDFDKEQLRGILYSMSNHGLAYSVQPGTWRILSREHNWQGEFNDTLITLAPYEQVLRSNFGKNGVTVMTYSDPLYGGDGVLRSYIHSGIKTILKETLYKFENRAEPLTALQANLDGSLWGVRLDEQGDPAEIVILKKQNGRYKEQVISLDDILKTAFELNPKDIFGVS